MDPLEVSGCQNDNPSFRNAKSSFKVTKNGVRLDASDWENLSAKNACALVFSGRRALDAGARRFPGVCPELSTSFPEAPRSPQSAKIWLRKAPGQDLAEHGRFPIDPEGAFTCRLGSPQIAKIWLQTAPGRFPVPVVPDGAVTCRSGGLLIAHIWFQTARGQDLAEDWPFPSGPRRRFYLPAGKPANCPNLAPKGFQRVKPVF